MFKKSKWEDYEKLMLQQKMTSLMKGLQDHQQVDQLWPDMVKETDYKNLNNFTVNFDLVNGKISVNTIAKDAKGRPQFDWKVDTNNGAVTQIKRQPDASEVSIIQKKIDLKELNKENFTEHAKKNNEETKEMVTEINKPDEKVIEEWNDLEAQRDIAFKIMYFFIIFILATFSLLYAYFRMYQKSEDEAAAKG